MRDGRRQKKAEKLYVIRERPVLRACDPVFSVSQFLFNGTSGRSKEFFSGKSLFFRLTLSKRCQSCVFPPGFFFGLGTFDQQSRENRSIFGVFLRENRSIFGVFLRENRSIFGVFLRENLARFHGADLAKTFMRHSFKAHPVLTALTNFLVILAQNCSHFFSILVPFLRKN